MPTEMDAALGKILAGVADALDISDSQFDEAKRHYEAIGGWLSQDESPIAHLRPVVYAQGSFKLGTVVRPVGGGDEYDVDLVCELKNLNHNQVSQAQLKDMVGSRLKSHKSYKAMIEEKNRCWRLEYADSTQFHVDIIPALPDMDLIGVKGLVDARYIAEAILITDRELSSWQRSNPQGYCEWFMDRMRVRFIEAKNMLAESLRANVEDVPNHKVKTPLQRAIQILKRHRDIMFKDDQDRNPISIIITTLAAHAYDNERDLPTALMNIARGMEQHIERRGSIPWVVNPVDPGENFADKWQKHPDREVAFRSWLGAVRSGLVQALQVRDVDEMVSSLKPQFGEDLIRKLASKVLPSGLAVKAARPASVPHIKIQNPTPPWRK
jgi:hypothetical protein